MQARIPNPPHFLLTSSLPGNFKEPKKVELVDRLAVLVVVRCLSSLGAADDTRFLRSESYARMKEYVRQYSLIPFRRFLGDVRLEFMQRLFCGTLWHVGLLSS
jgi:hypothetical protein